MPRVYMPKKVGYFSRHKGKGKKKASCEADNRRRGYIKGIERMMVVVERNGWCAVGNNGVRKLYSGQLNGGA